MNEKIDIKKYEGHTEGPWELITNYSEEDWDNKWVSNVHLFTTLGISFDVVGVNETDVQLMADAPLILDAYNKKCKEVERLRRELEHIQNDMAWTVQVWQNENYMGRQDWMEQMCEIYADLAKGIEGQYRGDEEE